MMGDNRGISPLNISGNVTKKWKLWKMRFENYMIAMELDQKDQAIQCAQFLHNIGEDAFKIYTTFELLDEEKNKLDVLIKKFETYFLSKENLSYERYQFFKYKQSPEQTFEQFVRELKKKATKCKLGKLQDSLTKVMIICGVSNSDMRQRLLDDDTLELDQAIQLCKVIETEVTSTESAMESCSSSYEDEEEVNANVTTNSINNDIINPNSIHVTNNATATSKDVDVNTETSDKTIEINEVANEPVKVPTAEIDLSDIVEEEPIPFNVEGYYEGDKVVMSSDKLLLVDNEANTKVISKNNENEPKLIYAKTQWSPSNPEGVKKYERDFLMALKDFPASKRMPDSVPEYILTNDGGLPPKHNRQSKLSNRGSPKDTMPMLKVSIIAVEDENLHETKKARHPARQIKSKHATNDRKIDKLYKKVRKILNKLTPQTFETLVPQIKKLQIDTFKRLQGVVDLFFEKTVDELNSSYIAAYARMCKELALIAVPSSESTEDKPEFVNFKTLLIGRCEYIIEKQSVNEQSIGDEKLKEIEACTDSEKKKNHQFALETYDRQLHMKSLGHIQFIGELFKQGMLTNNIVMRYLDNLLKNQDEKSLECLCKLLMTISKELEIVKDLNPIFDTIKNIIDKKEGKVSDRIRFMLQDVTDLKNSKYVPCRQEDYLHPTTIDQTQTEPKSKETSTEIMIFNLDKYVTGSYSEELFFLQFTSRIPSSDYPSMIKHSYLQALHKSRWYRLRMAGLFAKLLKAGIIKLEDYCVGLQWMQMVINEGPIIYPNIWDKLAEMLGDLICEEVLPLNRLYSIFEQGSVEMLLPLFKLVVAKKDADFLQNAWQASGLRLCDFMSTTVLISFIKDNQSQFLLNLTYYEIKIILLDFLKSKKSLYDIVNWITKYVGDRVEENKFIRALATAIFQDSINDDCKLVPETLSAHNNLLFIYVNGNPLYELQCLYALHALIHGMRYPPGLLLLICEKLYEMKILSQESFISWENSMDTAEQQGKGADGIPVSTPTEEYLPQQPNCGDNQSSSPRVIKPTVPPNQASVPPNVTIKAQKLPQQLSMNQTSLQPTYGIQTPFVLIPKYIPTANVNVPYYGQQLPSFVSPTMPLYSGQPLMSYQYNGPQTQAPSLVNFYYNQPMLQKTGALQQAQPTQAAIRNIPLFPNTTQHQPFQGQQYKQRPKTPITDPDTALALKELSSFFRLLKKNDEEECESSTSDDA